MFTIGRLMASRPTPGPVTDSWGEYTLVPPRDVCSLILALTLQLFAQS